MPETENDTIAAIATAMAPAGIGIIRISGDRAVPIGESLFRDIRGEGKLTDHPAGSLRHGHFVDAYGMILDEGMAVYFVAPRSYSGEDMVELQCHGGLLVLQRVLEAVLAAGARLAKPGEFSRRAFLNGRMDLTQAEAVMDLIGAENDLALSAARKQLGGLLGARIRSLREKLIHESAFIEAALDDPESFDGALEGYPDRLKCLAGEIRSDIQMLLDTADQGILSRNGIRTAIIGRPNVGKSSILNLLTGTERAIVSDISGTTRDTIEESVRLGALTLHLIDTAGLVDGSDHPVDAIESIGIARAKASMEEAQLILFIFDITKGVDDEMGALLKKVRSQHSIVIANKTDLCTGPEEREQFSRQVHFFSENEPVVFLSAKTGEGLPNLKEETEKLFLSEKPADAAVPVIASTRHKMLLQEAESGLLSLEETIGKGLTEDFYVVDLMRAYRALGEIIGEEIGDDLVEEIFSKFCMGK